MFSRSWNWTACKTSCCKPTQIKSEIILLSYHIVCDKMPHSCWDIPLSASALMALSYKRNKYICQMKHGLTWSLYFFFLFSADRIWQQKLHGLCAEMTDVLLKVFKVMFLNAAGTNQFMNLNDDVLGLFVSSLLLTLV